MDLLGHSNWITAIQSMDDGQLICSGDDNGELIIWDPIVGERKFILTVYHKNIITCLSIIERYKRLASASSD